jgi:hypothetical protein
MSLGQSVRVVKGSLWVLPVLVSLACGTRDIKKPAPDPEEDQLDAQAMLPPVKLDSAVKPNTLTDGPPAAADAPLASDGPGPDLGPDGPIECVPACGTGQACNNGQCESVCAAGQTVCKSGCSDLSTDPKNCGVCEKNCQLNEYCSKGLCVTACGQGETKCGQSCVNLGTDRANCGVCGTVCAGAEECAGGICKCTGANRVCDGTCQNLTNNRSHCGACGNRCQGQLVCRGRECGCPSGRMACPNMPTTCVANLNDCCPGDQVWCNDRCVSLKTDSNNCGSCGHNCPGAQKCSESKCGCPSSQPKTCPSGVCLPAGQCCSNETKCGDGSCIPNTTCCTGQKRCTNNNTCIPNADCCTNQTKCGDGSCIANTTCCTGQKRCTNNNTCIPNADCCTNQTKCADGTCIANTACCAGQKRCTSTNTCIPNDECCSDQKKCGDKCISNAADVCCPSDPNPCGDDAHMCNASNKCVCVVTCPNNQKCAAKLADCCPSGEDLCGSVCCGLPNMCMNGVCQPPGPPGP